MKLKNKISLFFCALLATTSIYAQDGRVGVNTENPTRTLHIEGDAQVKGLQSTTAGDYSKMLVTDGNGNVDYANLWTVNPTRKRVWHMQYQVASPGRAISNNTLKTERFEFRFENVSSGTDHGRIQFRLMQNPGKMVRVYFNMEENWGDGTVPPDGYQYSATPQGLEFTSGNPSSTRWDTWRYPISQSQSRIAEGEMNELYISYPDENAFYRVLIYRMLSGTTSIWIITAEEYGN